MLGLRTHDLWKRRGFDKLWEWIHIKKLNEDNGYMLIVKEIKHEKQEKQNQLYLYTSSLKK